MRKETSRARRRKNLMGTPDRWFTTMPELQTRPDLVSAMQTDRHLRMVVFSTNNLYENIASMHDPKAAGQALHIVSAHKELQLTYLEERFPYPVFTQFMGVLKDLHRNLTWRIQGTQPPERAAPHPDSKRGRYSVSRSIKPQRNHREGEDPPRTV